VGLFCQPAIFARTSFVAQPAQASGLTAKDPYTAVALFWLRPFGIASS
jgi:hypothetical protein